MKCMKDTFMGIGSICHARVIFASIFRVWPNFATCKRNLFFLQFIVCSFTVLVFLVYNV